VKQSIALTTETQRHRGKALSFQFSVPLCLCGKRLEEFIALGAGLACFLAFLGEVALAGDGGVLQGVGPGAQLAGNAFGV
jgi:hypothetical protein